MAANSKERIDWAELYRNFSANITDHDCGKTCKGGEWCCKTVEDTAKEPVHIVTLFGYGEGEFLEACYPGVEIKFDLDEQHIGLLMCGFKGKCNRKYRPFMCRTFPFFPVVDLDRKIVGMYKLDDIKKDCPMKMINPEWVNQWIAAWNVLLEKDDIFEWIYSEGYIHDQRVQFGSLTAGEVDYLETCARAAVKNITEDD